MADAEADMIARVNSIRVSADELMRVSEEVGDYSAEFRDGDALLYVTAQMFKPDFEKEFAVCERMYALVTLITGDSIPKAMVPIAEDGGLLVSDELLRVAAEQPILFRGNRATFDADSFLRALLKGTSTNGTA